MEHVAENVGVFAVDPGVTTGWCFMSANKLSLESPKGNAIESISYWKQGKVLNDSENESVDEIIDLIENIKVSAPVPYCIVIEDFILRKPFASREILTPVRVSAALEYGINHTFGPKIAIFKQSPAMAKTTATDDRLKSWGLYESQSGPDARDATRHAITFLRRCGDGAKGQIIRKAAWPSAYRDGKS